MTYIAPRTEALARAMCEAINYSPDGLMHDLPPTDEGRTSRCWHMFAHEAGCWIYEHSGGELPEREGEVS